MLDLNWAPGAISGREQPAVSAARWNGRADKDPAIVNTQGPSRCSAPLATSLLLCCLGACTSSNAAQATSATASRVEDMSIADLAEAQVQGRLTSLQIVDAYLARIATLDRSGPTLRSVLAVNPLARAQARALDHERATGHVRGPLHGIPLLFKDNIETADPLPTTAGSLALAANRSGRDAPLVARLRAAGVVVLGKTNLSEWAFIRASVAVSGWSAVGGQTRNPYALDRSPCGSSSGSAAAVAAGLAAAAIGTETDGSITCPASMNGLVGIKPTVGLVSRTYVVPISQSSTPGPITIASRMPRCCSALWPAQIVWTRQRRTPTRTNREFLPSMSPA